MFEKLFVNRSSHVLVQFFRYSLVGTFAFLLDAGLLFLLINFDFFRQYYLLAASLSFLLGITVNYILSIRWVFADRSVKNPLIEFGVFALIGLSGLMLNLFFIWFFTEHVFTSLFWIEEKRLRIMIAKLFATAIVYLWNFTAKKVLLFRKPEKVKE